MQQHMAEQSQPAQQQQKGKKATAAASAPASTGKDQQAGKQSQPAKQQRKGKQATAAAAAIGRSMQYSEVDAVLSPLALAVLGNAEILCCGTV